MPEIRETSVDQLTDQAGQLALIDVRTPVEFRQVRAPGAKNVPLDQLNAQQLAKELGTESNAPVYVICYQGGRSRKACELLAEAGVEQPINVAGGMAAWEKAGLPVVREQSVMSLERQVRIAAGGITFVGSLAALVTGNVYYAAVPAFIGAGLVFAGVTNTCGMGMLIAKMPWNR